MTIRQEAQQAIETDDREMRVKVVKKILKAIQRYEETIQTFTKDIEAIEKGSPIPPRHMDMETRIACRNAASRL